MENRQTFTLVFGKEFQQGEYYLGGFDPYDDSVSIATVLMTKPKKEYGIKKIKGFNRVVNIGWSYIAERI
jgi:hypothetical protein